MECGKALHQRVMIPQVSSHITVAPLKLGNL
jgi:hypothetical protein